MNIAALLIIVAVFAVIYWVSQRYGGNPDTTAPPAENLLKEKPAARDTKALYAVAKTVEKFFEDSAHPRDLLDNEEFQRGVASLSREHYSDAELLDYYAGDNTIIGCMALAALKKRTVDQKTIDRIIYYLDGRGTWSLYFAFDLVGALSSRPVIGAVLLEAPSWVAPGASPGEVFRPRTRARRTALPG